MPESTQSEKASATDPPDRASRLDVTLTHIGGPTTLIEVGGWRLLTDPTFDPPGRRYAFALGTSSRKLAGPVIAPGQLPPIDAVLLSHDHHADNLDDAGRALLPQAGTVITTRAGARRLGRGAQGLAPWEVTRLEAPGKPTIRVVATPARHGPPLSRPVVGEVTGFALEWEGQNTGVFWITGDTVRYRRLREVSERLAVDTMLLHLGSVKFGLTGPLRYTMTARDAIALCAEVRPRLVVPVHHEGWSHFSEQTAAARRAFDESPADIRARLRWLEPGVATRDLNDAQQHRQRGMRKPGYRAFQFRWREAYETGKRHGIPTSTTQ